MFEFYTKDEKRLLTKLNNCKTRKCSKIHREVMKASKRFEKEQNIKCPQKSFNSTYHKCFSHLYNKSNYKKLHAKYIKCGEKKCSKERKTFKKDWKKLNNPTINLFKANS